MKYLASFALTLALATLPAWAAIDASNITWIENVPGATLLSSNYDDDGELEVEFKVNSEKVYDEIVNGLRSRGWRVISQKTDRDCPGMPDINMAKDNYRLELDMDRERNLNGVYYEMNISIE